MIFDYVIVRCGFPLGSFWARLPRSTPPLCVVPSRLAEALQPIDALRINPQAGLRAAAADVGPRTLIYVVCSRQVKDKSAKMSISTVPLYGHDVNWAGDNER